MKQPRKWNHLIRTMVFSRLAAELGRDYHRESLLRHQHAERQKAIVEELATHLTQITGTTFKASEITQQINWALGEPTVVKKSHVTVYAQCKVAAYEAGLIGRISARPVTLGT